MISLALRILAVVLFTVGLILAFVPGNAGISVSVWLFSGLACFALASVVPPVVP